MLSPRRLIRRLRHTRLHRPDARLPYLHIGTEYGGWPVLPDRLGLDSIVYAAGVGTDISFDLGVIDRFGCVVEAFDPTPRCLAWIRAQALPPEFRFDPVGVGAEDGEVPFFEPKRADYVSFSAQPGEGASARPLSFPVRRIGTLMAARNHDRLDVLKIDIEGFEYAVIDDLLASGIRPGQLLVEFHHGMYGIEPKETLDAVEKLKAAGYGIFYVSDAGHEYGLALPDG